MIQKKYMLARKLLGGIVAAAAVSVMILAANAPAQATTTPEAPSAVTHSDNRYAPNSITALPHCNDDNWAPPDYGPLQYGANVPIVAGNYNCILETGNSNRGVSALQSNLNACYQKTLTVDGKFGTATGQALRDVQQKIATTVDGVYGPGTRTKMLWGNNGGGCRPITAFYGF